MAQKKRPPKKKLSSFPGIEKRFAALRKKLDKVHRAHSDLEDEIQRLEDHVIGAAGPGDPRLLSVVPTELSKLLK